MIVKKLTYSGFDGVTITEDFYFNMTAAELTEKELIYPGGFANHLQTIVKEDNRPEIIKAFKDLILWSVGERAPDGKGFLKKGVAERFEATEAYSALFMEIILDTAKCVEFFNGVMPKDLAEKMEAHMKAASGALELPEAKAKTFPDDYSEAELLAMPQDEFDRELSKIKGNVPKGLLMIAMRRPRA